jgi:YesN/AraC family two-component response regulator
MGPAKSRPIQSVIVDDDRSIGGILKELISGQHAPVEVFNDAREAIEYIREQTVDIIITDLMMPDVNGLDVLSFAKSTNPDSVVIIITGHGTLETAIEAVRKGAYDYIKKPFKLDEIEIAFNNAVEKIQLVRKNQELLKELKNTCDELVAVKKAYRGSEEEEPGAPEKAARLNFFSTSVPNLEFLRKVNEDQHRLYERLHHVSRLKKDGLLSEKEFKALKNNIIKALEMYALQ